jgi:hypothetical protein
MQRLPGISLRFNANGYGRLTRAVRSCPAISVLLALLSAGQGGGL